MLKSFLLRPIVALLVFLNFAAASAAPAESADSARQDNTVPSLFGNKGNVGLLGHFSWGADFGTGVDLTANDMTFLNIQAYFGYKSAAVRLAGIGAGINSMINNSSRAYPVFGILRTSFSSRPKLCFMDLRLGVSFSHFHSKIDQTDFFGSLGLGVTLASGRRFSSHLIFGYTFMPVHSNKITADGNKEPSSYFPARIPDLHFASIRLGCAF